MASTWQNPNNEISNFDFYDNNDVRQTTVIGSCKWCDPETAAWRCNQRDDCGGFTFNKAQGYGAWFVKRDWNWSGTDGSRQTYVKKTTSWRKANQPDTSDLSILPANTSTTAVKLFDYYGGRWDGSGGGQVWNLTQPGLLSPWGGNTPLGTSTGQSYGNDAVASYCMPLGWKFVFDENGNDGAGDVEGYWDRGNQPGCYNMDQPYWHNMTDRLTEGIIQNIGFDINAHFNDMTSLGVTPEDAKQIKLRWCSASNANLDTQNCKNFFADTTQNGAGLSWYAVKLALCDGQGGHAGPNDPSCVNAINNVQKSTAVVDGVSQGTATTLVQTYCDANPTSPLCACYNVTQYDSRCISDASKKTLPGCDNLNTDFGNLPNYASVIAADKFCASSDCITKALSSSTAFMPVARSPQQTCPTIQACIQDFRNANFNGSSLTAECKQTLNITGSPAAVGVQPPSPAGTPAGTPLTQGTDGSKLPITNPAVANVLDTSTKQYAAAGSLCVFILCCCLVLLLLMMGGGGGSASTGLGASNLALARLMTAGR